MEVLDEPHDLRLDGDVERRGRLVGDQDVGFAQQRHGDHHALAHAAGKLVRIGGELRRRVGNADPFQHGNRARLERVAAKVGVTVALRVDELRAQCENRIERSHRILEDHRDTRAAQLAQRLRLERQKILPVERDASRHAAGVFREKSEQGKRERRLAAAALADKAEDLTPADRQADVAQHVQGTVARRRSRRTGFRSRRAGRTSWLAPQLGIDGVAQRLAEQSEAECGERQHGRPEPEPARRTARYG